MNHEELQQAIPAYAASRLEGEVRHEMADHLAACAGCREMAETCAEIFTALRDGGEALFEPHPDELALRDYARGMGGERMAAVRRHLPACMTCSLEAQAWTRRQDSALESVRRPTRRRIGFPRPLSAAAGILLGFGVAYLLLRREAAPPRAVEPPVSAPPIVKPWTGHAPHWILPGATRGEESAISLRIVRGETYVVVSFRPSLPEDQANEEECRFEIRREDGRTIWSSKLPAAAVRADLDSNEGVAFVIPASILDSGRYEFRMSIPAAGGDSVLYRVAAQIDRNE